MLLAGLVDGDGAGGFGATVAATPEQGRAVVDRYKKAGFQQMKLYCAAAAGRRFGDHRARARARHDA